MTNSSDFWRECTMQLKRAIAEIGITSLDMNNERIAILAAKTLKDFDNKLAGLLAEMREEENDN